jgi:hypothetical protein
MDYEGVHEHLAYLDGRSSEDMHEAIAKLEELGVDIPGLMMKKYQISRRWADRASCVYHCIQYAVTHEEAYQVGIIALQDKSRAVRHKACMLLSAAQKKEAIEHLEKLLSDKTSRNDAVAAIDLLLNLKQT